MAVDTGQPVLHMIWEGDDLVVGADDPERDTRDKRIDYAEAGISEYWVVDPITETVTVLTLVQEAYIEHGIFRRGEQATSASLQDIAVEVDEMFDARWALLSIL